MFDRNSLENEYRIGKCENISELAMGKHIPLLKDLTSLYAHSTSMTGRDKELKWICCKLLCKFKPNILIVGEPGVGKTALI